MSGAKVMSVRLEDPLVESIDRMVAAGEFASRTEAIEVALSEMLRTRAQLPQADKVPVTVPLPQKFVDNLDFLVGIDYYPSRENAVYEAVKTLLYHNVDLIKVRRASEEMDANQDAKETDTRAKVTITKVPVSAVDPVLERVDES